jgi:hypothetical protein
VTEAVKKEVSELVLRAMTERADAMGEILAQAGSFVGDFAGLLDCNTVSHAKTIELISACVSIAGFAGQHFKQVNDRRRPSHVAPALKPPIDVPGHGSYPSNHAAQAFLVMDALGAVFGTKKGAAERAQNAAMPAVRALAARIAVNREIAGVHYPSDTEAGRELARKLLPILNSPQVPRFEALVTAAAAEWD